jgi:predicted metal-dependent hydrolase
MTDNVYSVCYGNNEIKFDVNYSNRRTLEIAVLPDCLVAVKAPVHSDINKIHSLVRKRARWIIKQQEYFRQFLPRTDSRQYLSGETHLYLGRRYRLKVQQSEENDVMLSRGTLYVRMKQEVNREQVKKQLTVWYNNKAKEILPEIAQECWKCFSSLKIKGPVIQIRMLKTRWGSLSSNSILTLNADLIKAPRECIRYVIIHEFCHLKYYNHNIEFYNLLEKIMPEWKKVKHKLELHMA